MSDARDPAYRYFTIDPELDAFVWSSDGETIDWSSGGVAAFWQELSSVTEALHRNEIPLPSFPSLVLLLASASLRGVFSSAQAAVLEDRLGSPRIAQRTLDQLRTLSQVDSELWLRPSARTLLAIEVFRHSGSAEPGFDDTIIQGLRSGLDPEVRTQSGGRVGIARGFDRLVRGLERFDAQRFARQVVTGLDALPEADDIELGIPDRARAFIDRLRQDPESDLAEIGRLAHDFKASLRLPRQLDTPDELPFGGYADVDSRGPLDRLLLSELAHDDLTLAIRVAVGEALYYRREPPVRSASGVRRILVDSGVSLWGAGRLHAIAAVLALAATQSGDDALDLTWMTSDGLRHVDLLTDDGLKSALESLEPTAATIASLEEFLDDRVVAKRADWGVDRIIVTHRRRTEALEFRRLVQEHTTSRLFVVAVDAERGLDLLEAKPLGFTRLIHVEARDVAPRAVASSGHAPSRQARRRSFFPLRRTACPPLQWRGAPDGALYSIPLRKQRRGHSTVKRWTSALLGAEEFESPVPKGRIVGFEVAGNERTGVHVDLLCRHGINGIWQRLDGKSGAAERHEFVMDRTLGDARPIWMGNTLIFLSRRGIARLDARSGAVKFLRNRSVQKSFGRFFHHGDEWTAIGAGASGVRFTLVPGSPSLDAFVFDRPGRDGPWVFEPRSRSIRSTVESEQIIIPSLPALSRPLRISGDGDRMLLHSGHVVDIESGRLLQTGSDAKLALEPNIAEIYRPRSVFQRVSDWSVNSDGSIEFSTEQRWRFNPVTLRTSAKGPTPSPPPAGRDPSRYAVHQRRDGVARFDGRGGIRLSVADSSIPDVMLTLCPNGEGAACIESTDSTTGFQHFGSQYFTGQARSNPTDALVAILRQHGRHW